MNFPELSRSELNSMKPSGAFLLGLRRRLCLKPKSKVFIIGFHKTGTSSMGKALQILGYRVCGSLKEGVDLDKIRSSSKSELSENTCQVLGKYDAFQDTPWFLFYKELYDAFPDAKFILTIRDEDKWIKSIQRHFGNNSFQYHDYIYGSHDTFADENKYRQIYNKHNNECKMFFLEKKKEILIIDLEHDINKWQLICNYLNVNSPRTKFPYANKANYNRKLSSRLKKVLKKIYYK
ncbi:sulfotransferase family protein [Winogradskyella arenosi]|uniref:Sulfotransferase family protein n=1 Tax=Winogradskyella arenosi TaxID=533325 RepID=A0A368ZGN2_9FLAO|nr:sulfotransferase family protein [Winogradskyella arenosi]RCW91493.1 sulfotransferase family protein [Winogradskyella arenosi]